MYSSICPLAGGVPIDPVGWLPRHEVEPGGEGTERYSQRYVGLVGAAIPVTRIGESYSRDIPARAPPSLELAELRW